MAEDETFKVTDRRRRDETDESPTDPAPPDPVAPAPRAAAAASASQGPAPAPQGGPDLQGLFIMLASSALVNLGEAADPETGERVLDLEQAKEAIDLLSLLRVKTEGNRTDQESHLLEEMLYDLQLRFVRAAKG
jgi:3-oxoacyl-ACP reductase-like protein